MKVEAGHARRFLRTLVEEVDADVDLVRRLVAGEARIAMDAEHRAAGRPRVGDETWRDPGQARREVADEAQRRVADVRFVALPVHGEPLPVVVLAELAQKRARR